MKRAIVLMLVLCTIAISQPARPKLIVSVSGELPLDWSDVLMDGVSYGIKRNSNNIYDVMANDRQFKEALKKEWKKGNINDDKIMDMAKNAGADFLCFVKINSVKSLKGKQVVAQLINLNSSPMISVQDGMVTIKDDFKDLDHLTSILLKVVEDMLGTSVGGEQVQNTAPSADFEIPSSKKQQREAKMEIEEEEEQTIAEEKTEPSRKREGMQPARTQKTVGAMGLAVGGGISVNMNDISPKYFKSLGGQVNIAPEFNRQDLGFFRAGLNVDLGGLSVNKDEARKKIEDVDSNNIETITLKINAFARLYPVSFLFLSGGAGFGVYDVGTKGKAGNIENVSAPVFPVGGGIFLNSSGGHGFIVEALCNVIPFKNRTAKYVSINVSFIVDMSAAGL